MSISDQRRFARQMGDNQLARAMLQENGRLQQKIKGLEEENKRLREQLSRLLPGVVWK